MVYESRKLFTLRLLFALLLGSLFVKWYDYMIDQHLRRVATSLEVTSIREFESNRASVLEAAERSRKKHEASTGKLLDPAEIHSYTYQYIEHYLRQRVAKQTKGTAYSCGTIPLIATDVNFERVNYFQVKCWFDFF